MRRDHINMAKHSNWDRRFLELAKHIAQWSKDPSTKVGAIITRGNEVVGIGYNGFPRGVFDLPERLNDRPTKYQFVVHAEANAILMAGEKAKGATIYVWPSFVLPPLCNECAKLVIQSGIKEVVGYEPGIADARYARWNESINIAGTMCEEAGVSWRGVKE